MSMCGACGFNNFFASGIRFSVSNIFFNGQSKDVLMLGTSSAKPQAFYISNMNAVGVDFDFIDYVVGDRKNMPRIWNPSMGLLLDQYEKVVIFV